MASCILNTYCQEQGIGVSSSALFSPVSMTVVKSWKLEVDGCSRLVHNCGLKFRLYEKGGFPKGFPPQSQIFLVDNKAFLCCIVSPL